jgi:hypothetical protein
VIDRCDDDGRKLKAEKDIPVLDGLKVEGADDGCDGR